MQQSTGSRSGLKAVTLNTVLSVHKIMDKSTRLAMVAPVPIQLVDEDVDDSDVPQDSNTVSSKKHASPWATDVHVGECTIVNGTNNQRFAVWAIAIDTSKGGHMRLLKRYSEFDTLRNKLLNAFPDHSTEIPRLPPKKVFGNLKTEFLAKRRRGLEFFISCVLLNPVLGNSDIVKQFVSSATQ